MYTEQEQKAFGTEAEGDFRVGGPTVAERRGDEARGARGERQDRREGAQVEIRRKGRDENVQQSHSAFRSY